ncbi:uncharacterized protein B0I36DRAFT_362840 [Microdochium trichocladiopsis]|uniref:PH domain-containing protein n=1 Tax=Microdochium trichocladiopsis TaxID=1682393 RepID=A0A9P8Y9D7_9PEZI|nr:uncharacterized protein B0I36DRAFT_362840 [Microdochium trichocladiopsis]KAH7031095.1 hypothetical protein B0I36DRAFT_362840 [Microdochium trichocladiopsis]
MAGGAELVGSLAGALTRAHIETNKSTYSLRERPPHLDALAIDSQRVPLKQDRLNKRESKLSLRNIFGRQKTKRDVIIPEQGPPRLESPTSPGSSSFMSDAHPWSYAPDSSMSTLMLQHSSNSLDHTGSSPLPSAHSTPGEFTGDYRANKRASMAEPIQGHASVASMPWPPPPLCEAYQQAVKRAMMSMCTAPIETLQRISSTAADGLIGRKASDASDLNKRSEHRRRLNRNTMARNPIEFASKIYVLTTSSWLFQYAADGDNDRPPERALRITKDSAAFASDLIPGRHWVIQVLSVADTAISANIDNKGRKTRLKGVDKRQVSNFLLVCETPEDMESWLSVLRHEIEILGGRKKASETGVADDTGRQREEARYSQIIREDFSWNQENALSMDKLERTPELLQDDGSTTASLDSSDGNNLESPRDSSGNRFSVASMELRAFGTPPNSSPACSPTRPNFSSYHDSCEMEHLPNMAKSIHGAPEIRTRPNAAAILTRRQSRQAVNGDLDIYTVSGRRQSVESTRRDSAEHEYVSAPQSIPNFSIPQAVSRRFSSIQPPAITISQSTPPSPPQAEPAGQDLLRPTRRAPPTALPLSRPLSVVVDLPSPISPRLSPGPSRQHTQGQERLPGLDAQLQAPGALASIGATRRFVSLSNLRHPQKSTTEVVPEGPASRPDPVRAMERAQGLSPTIGYFGSPTAFVPRSSMAVEFSHPANYRHSMLGEPVSLDATLQARPSTAAAGAGPATTSFLWEARSSSLTPRTLATQRSMPSLGDMPPPAPPPTCALPPIPPRYAPPTCALPPIPTSASAKRRSRMHTAATPQTATA